MLLQRRDPFRNIRRANYRGDSFWRGYGIGDEATTWALPLDLVEHDNEVVVSASLPGFKTEDVEVTVEKGVLSIKAERTIEEEKHNGSYLIRERRNGAFRRSIRLPETVDAENADTGYADGVLTVTFPRLEATKPKRLEIKAAA